MSTGLELFGGLGLLLGLFTRFWAAAIALEMAYITFFLYWDNGMSWLNRGYEFSLMWGLVCFAISLRGGGQFSLDRLMRDRKSTRLNSSHYCASRIPSSA